MKKIIICLLVLIISFQPVLAQKPKSTFLSAGFSLFGGSDQNSRNTTLLPSITVFPGVRFAQSKGFRILAGLPLSAGLSYDKDGNDLYAGLDLPFTVNLCFGSAFNNGPTRGLGFFLGGGAGYHVSHNESYYWDGSVERNHLRVIGTIIQTGITIPFSKEEKGNGGIAFRLSWLADPDVHKNVFGLGILAWGDTK